MVNVSRYTIHWSYGLCCDICVHFIHSSTVNSNEILRWSMMRHPRPGVLFVGYELTWETSVGKISQCKPSRYLTTVVFFFWGGGIGFNSTFSQPQKNLIENSFHRLLRVRKWPREIGAHTRAGKVGFCWWTLTKRIWLHLFWLYGNIWCLSNRTGIH